MYSIIYNLLINRARQDLKEHNPVLENPGHCIIFKDGDTYKIGRAHV